MIEPVRGELRVAMGGLKDDLWISNNPLARAGATSIGVVMWGLGETLSRVSPRGEVVPWLAESIRCLNLDPRTWRVTLRHDVRFWDGTPLSAQAVADSFAHACEAQKDVDLLLSRDTHVTVVDARTLEFRTPQPTGHFAAALAHPQLVVQSCDGANLTGPFQPVDYEPDRQLVLEAFAGHWSGPPAIRRITVRVIPDLDARLEAYESGETDLMYAYPPEAIDRLEPFARQSQSQVTSWPSMRMHSIQLNCTRPPFDDRSVRQATSLAIDRQSLVGDVLGGHGAATTSLAPPWSAESMPCGDTAPDVAHAERLLDEAGWRIGPDGVRCKGDQRLEFSLYTPTGPVLAMNALARRISHQLAQLGYAITPQEVPALSGAVKDGAYTAALRTGYSQLTGDPYFWLKLWLEARPTSRFSAQVAVGRVSVTDCA